MLSLNGHTLGLHSQTQKWDHLVQHKTKDHSKVMVYVIGYFIQSLYCVIILKGWTTLDSITEGTARKYCSSRSHFMISSMDPKIDPRYITGIYICVWKTLKEVIVRFSTRMQSYGLHIYFQIYCLAPKLHKRNPYKTRQLFPFLQSMSFQLVR